MHLVFDSNMIISAGYGNSNMYQFLERLAKVLGYNIHMPAPVIDEVTAKMEEELHKVVEDSKTATRKWERNLNKSIAFPLNGIEPKQESDALRCKLEAYDSVLPYPDVSHQELTERAIHRRKPFDSKGSGHRDALIWEAVLTLADKDDDQVVLLSNDGAFNDGKGLLSSELKAELVQRGLEQSKVVLMPSIDEFVKSYIQPELKVILESEETEALTRVFDMDPDEDLALWVQDEWARKEWTGEELGLRWEYETLFLSIINGVSQWERLETSEITEDEYLLSTSAILDCEFDAFVPKAYTYGLEDFSVNNFDWNRHYAEGSTTVVLQCKLDLVVKFAEDNHPPQISLLSVELVGE